MTTIFSPRHNRAIARLLMALMAVQALPLWAQPLADPAAPAGRRPIVDAAPNGVRLVHIAPPNAARVSHNLYKAFDVPAAGVILNNRGGSGPTELGGSVGGNPQLGGVTAALIVNEVTTGPASNLLGRIEVAGPAADVVVANPWGIACDACGFINTTRATLATGRPAFGSDGRLSTITVEGGTLALGSRGLVAHKLPELDLLARNLTVADGASVLAEGQLLMVLGRNAIEHATLAATPLADAGGKPAYALQVPTVAALNARQIVVVATEQGVGVRQAGVASARTGGLQIEAVGPLQLDGATMRAEGGSLLLNGTGVAQTGGSLESTDSLVLAQASQGLELTGVALKGRDLILSAGADARLSDVSLEAGADARIVAGGRLQLEAGRVQAGADLVLGSGGDLSIAPKVSAASTPVTGGSTTRTVYLPTELRAGRDALLQAPGGIVNLDGTGLSAGGQIAVLGQSIGLIGPKDHEKTSTTSGGKTTVIETETLTPGSLRAGLDISLVATGMPDPAADPNGERGHILLTGARVDSDAGQVSLLARRDVDIAHDVVSSSVFQEYWQKRRRLLYTKTTHVISSTLDQSVKPSEVGGRSVAITAGGDLNVLASTVVADGAVGLHADQDLSLLSTGEVHQAYNLKTVRKSGIFASGSFGITIGNFRRTEISDMLSTQQVGATVGSSFGDIALTAGNQYLQLSSEVVAGSGDVAIAAREVAIQTNNNTRSLINSVRQTQSGITLSAGHPLITAAQTTIDMAKAVERTENPRLKALGVLTAGLSVWQAYKDLAKSKSTNPADWLSPKTWTFNATLGSSSYAYDSVYDESLPQESQILAGRHLSIVATGAASAQQGDINIIGSGLSASGDVTLNAANDLNLVASTARTTEQTRTRSSSGAVGISMGSQGTSFTLSASKTRGFTNGWGTTYFPVEVSAGGTLSFDAWRDANISGATLDGTRVVGKVGSGGSGNLVLTSPLDQSHVIAKESSLGFNLTVGSSPSFGLSLSHLKLLADWQGAREQTAIRAGSGGFDLSVNGTTYLRGAAITSTADASVNRLTTQTLLHETVANRDNASGVASSVQLTLNHDRTDGKGALAGSAFGYAQIERANLGSTAAALAPAMLTLTRPDLQATIATTWRTRERTPVADDLATQQAKLNNLLATEPPKFGGTGIQAQEPGPGAESLAGDATGVEAAQTPTPEWNDWNYQVTLARTAISQLTATLVTIDTKVYGQPGNLSRSPNTSHLPLPPALDSKRATDELRNGVAITAAFGKAAFREAGDYADKKRDEELKKCNNSPKDCAGYEAWKEGGKARVTLHAVIGALGYGTAGAVGAAANQLAAPVIEEVLVKAGLATRDPVTSVVTYTPLGDVVRAAAGSAIGFAVGAAPGMAAAMSADTNNRQLHPEEKARIVALAAGDLELQQRLAAAACYLVRCSAEFVVGTEAHDLATRLERVGAGLTSEIDLLKAQRSPTGDQMFEYGFWASAKDSAVRINARTQIVKKLGGVGQIVGGGAVSLAGSTMVVTGTAGCPTTFGGGCAVAFGGTLLTLWGADQIAAGTRNLFSSQQAYTLGAHLISEMTGISRDAAELWYALPGVAVGGTAWANASKEASRLALEMRLVNASYGQFAPKGLTATPEVLVSPPVKSMLDEFVSAGRTAEQALSDTITALKSGSDLVKETVAVGGHRLFKVVPKGVTPSEYSPYWISAEQAQAVSKMTVIDSSNYLGLPLEQTATALANGGFDVYMIVLRKGEQAKLFTSTIASTEQNLFAQVGGAIQTIVPNRLRWTDAVKIDPKAPGIFLPIRCC